MTTCGPFIMYFERSIRDPSVLMRKHSRLSMLDYQDPNRRRYIEGVIIFTVVLLVIVAGVYTIVDACKRSMHLDDRDKNDLN